MTWLIVAFALVAVLLFLLYRRSLKENLALSNLAILILADPQIYAAQRKGLVEFVRSTDAKNASDLMGKVSRSTAQLATNLIDKTMIGASGMLWRLRTGQAD